MDIENIPFGVTEWDNVEATEHLGETGVAYWRTKHFGQLRVRMVDYSKNYLADHWCSKGHILLCLSGELTTELEDGRVFVLKPGMSYQVADKAEAHRSSTKSGARLFVVDLDYAHNKRLKRDCQRAVFPVPLSCGGYGCSV
ncbi:DHCW motif cupin fold protein [Vibrio mimicus]|uniref:DHCW motif cupin fold protein n=1 Tax=Vibrio mimicus TaxID=674 RepID=UPI002F92FAFB